MLIRDESKKRIKIIFPPSRTEPAFACMFMNFPLEVKNACNTYNV